ncbi:hypothetical protein FGIG_10870 [Fasciola gigantica]|uniref:Elongator complex protein 5 n=1 Tax=Fasciola gigantica TaxID=46835 RepID=A0A504YW95_FASGI|nr:hypothetical protein FGIG_10870 [Fasciola gigantica]
MLFQCPKQTEFEFWARRLLGILSEISSSEFVGRVTLTYRPVRSRHRSLIASSDAVLSSFNQCVTTLIKLQPPFVVSGLSLAAANDTDNRTCKMSLWHSRARQTDFNTTVAQNKNKPALYECFTVQMNLTDWSFRQFITVMESDSATVPTQESIQPESTFALTMTESEKIARSQVVLPYEAATVNTNTKTESQSSGMTIHYQPDCFDDLDDDDPDDDLEI